MKDTDTYNSKSLVLRKPSLDDGGRVYELIAASPPLDLNSAYCYFMLCSYFSETGVIADAEGETAGFISAYIVPERADTLFVWQVAVASGFRKAGLAGRMVFNILERNKDAGIRYIETTVTPSNAGSKAFFYSLAEKLKTSVSESMYIPADYFPAGGHEDEILYRIGPFNI